MKKLLLVLAVLSGVPARAIDGIYVGGQVGALGFTGANRRTAIGLGVDLGIRTNPVLDLNFDFSYSSHTGSLSRYSPTLSADFHVWEFNDIDFTVGGGPGFYFFSSPLASETKFGINFGTAADVKIEEAFRIGLGFRYHVLFSPTLGDNHWATVMRLGYLFNVGS